MSSDGSASVMYRSYCIDCDHSMRWGEERHAETDAENHSMVNPHTTRVEEVRDE